MGYDVISVLESGLASADDPDVWQWAIGEERVIVTYNLCHFVPLLRELFETRVRHPGIVLVSSFTVPTSNIGGSIRALRQLLEQNPDLADQAHFLTRA